MILMRGDLVRVALVEGATFSVLAGMASSPSGTLGTLALAALQTALVVAR
jgi:hypothetical protein